MLARTPVHHGRFLECRSHLPHDPHHAPLPGVSRVKDRKPKNPTASVRQRLLNLSRKSGEPFQTMLTRYALERLLFRLSQSAHKEQFTLKGAMLFVLWTGQMHRPTRDLDLLGAGKRSEEPT